MPSTDLKTRAKALLGRRWKHRIAHECQVTLRTIERYVTGDIVPPPDKATRIEELLR